MFSEELSRGAQIDTNLCVEKSGGNRFDLVILAAQRARELKKQEKTISGHTVTALLEIQGGFLDKRLSMKTKLW